MINKYFSTKEIRSKFIEYFVKNDHKNIPSSSLIPYKDNSIMFVNSGMVQFKNIFLGHKTAEFKKVVTCQKAIRAGGKHNDLDNVGYTSRHHTFFEMLGHFSFGSYFKEKAIYFAWELLTKEFCIDKNRLYITVHSSDEEAILLWKKISNFSSDKIITINSNDNFWSMGDIGPCGPCSEIFYDYGSTIEGNLPGSENHFGDRFVEIWNMVFMQFEQIDKFTLIDLPNKCIDTGSGIERIASVIQGKSSNYDIDLFCTIIDFIKSKLDIISDDNNKYSYQVIADHLRAIAFLIADGIVPSNEGRGYVLRRILRRSIRHVHLLNSNINDPIIYTVIPIVISTMGDIYPELNKSLDIIKNLVYEEEIIFKSTLSKGLYLLNKVTNNFQKKSMLPGETAFKLYDTYGFPLDLTVEILKNNDITVDTKKFYDCLKSQQDSNILNTNYKYFIDQKLLIDIKNIYNDSIFVGYQKISCSAKVLALFYFDNNRYISTNIILETDKQFIVILDKTPFYPESGGQIGDIGILKSKNTLIKVIDTKKVIDSIIIHVCQLVTGSLSINDKISAEIDVKFRNDIRINHTATHILHSVLKKILGSNVAQKGSLITDKNLRFDFNYSKALSQEELNLIELNVNYIIFDNQDVKITFENLDYAINRGALALFGEKYDNTVRVVSIKNKQIDLVQSLELCGGSHVSNTSEIGIFKITKESSVASGIRRIEAVCGIKALEKIAYESNLVKKISFYLNITESLISDKIVEIININKSLLKEVKQLRLDQIILDTNVIRVQSIKLAKGLLFYKIVNDIDLGLLRTALPIMSNKIDNLLVVYTNLSDNKSTIIIAVNRDFSKILSANNVIQKLSLYLNGSGGGNRVLAQFGGNFANKLHIIEDHIVQIVNEVIELV